MTQFKKINAAGMIKSTSNKVYDIELNNHHYFPANGIITHNCRLRNALTTKEFSFTNGNIGVNYFGPLYA